MRAPVSKVILPAPVVKLVFTVITVAFFALIVIGLYVELPIALRLANEIVCAVLFSSVYVICPCITSTETAVTLIYEDTLKVAVDAPTVNVVTFPAALCAVRSAEAWVVDAVDHVIAVVLPPCVVSTCPAVPAVVGRLKL